MNHLSIDIETFSSVDIKKSGLYKYVQSPDFEILLFAFSIDYGQTYVVDLAQGEVLPDYIVQALQDPRVVKHAFNAPFEWYCINKFYLAPAEQWQCTMLHSLYCGFTTALGSAAEAMGLPMDKRKMGVGFSMIKTFCCPVKPTNVNGQKTRIRPHHEPEKWNLFKEYCRQDVVTEMELAKRLSAFPVPDSEQLLWRIDLGINAMGVALDHEFIESAIHCETISTAELMAEAIELSGVKNPKSLKQLKDWLNAELEMDFIDVDYITTLDKAEIVRMLKDTGVTDNVDVERMLQLRLELGKSSVKKYEAMMRSICSDGRLRGLVQFYGANRTGRWAGRLVQVQNLPKTNMESLDYARTLVKARELPLVKVVYGNVPDTLSQLIRTAFVPEKGKVFIVADFSAIEARVIAWLSGESWRQEVFATHGKIYEASAAAMFNVPIDTIKKGGENYHLRAKGKVAELALGYQGSTGALINMGALDMGLEEDELKPIVDLWRAANRRIVDLWYSIQNVAIDVVKTGRSSGTHGIMFSRELDYQKGMDFFTIGLPSGRKLYYAKPFLNVNKWGGDALGYMGMNQTTKKWQKLESYGGKLVENIVQAIARDCLAHTLHKLHFGGYKVVMHVHDEVVIEATDCGTEANKAALAVVCSIMSEPIPWARGLKLGAEGFCGKFYKKE